MTFHGSNIVYFLKGDRPLVISNVKFLTSYVIDAHSETIISALLDKSLPGPVVGVIEATTKLSDCFHLFTATSISLPDSDEMVPLRILYPTDAPVLLHKGTSVGIFSGMAPDDVYCLLNPQKVQLQTVHLGVLIKYVTTRYFQYLNVYQVRPCLNTRIID